MTTVAYWSFDAGTSADDTGNGHDGTDTNVTYGVPAVLGKAAQFAGPTLPPPTQKIALAAIALGAGAWSAQAWYYPTANPTTGYSMILGKKYVAPNPSGFGLMFTGIVGAQANFDFVTGLGVVNSFNLNPAPGLNNPYHLVVTQSATGTLKQYINAALKATVPALAFNFSPDIIGHDDSDPSGFPNNAQGAIDEVALWDRELSAAEVTALYNGGAGIGYHSPAFPDGAPPPPPPLPPLTFANPTVAAQLATVDFGQDIDASDDLNPFLQLLDGLPNLGQALAHRLSTPRGSLPYDANYGYDVRELLNETMTPTRQAQLQVDIAGECRKDERVLAAQVAFRFSGTLLQLFINITTAGGPFRLVLGVTAVSVDVLAVL